MNNEEKFEMRFDPQTIRHLGLRMYTTLPPALAELISNAYDADAENVCVTLIEENSSPKEIRIEDDGIGMSFDDINNKFLVIGRNRREDEGDTPSQKHKRLPTGKKGLGKLALFGLAQTITVTSKRNGKLNVFILVWSDLISAKGSYHPRSEKIDEATKEPDGVVITLTGLKRKTSFDCEGLADSLSKIFIFDNTFKVTIETPMGDRFVIGNDRKYKLFEKEFKWILTDNTLFIPKESGYTDKITGEIFTAEKPLKPSSGLRGITLFSRGKLVNEPEFFSNSASSHFFQYLTGWITVDFIDLLEEDVISTNRQSIDWEHPEMAKLRNFLSGIVSQINSDWRKKRKEKKDEELRGKTGIDTDKWFATLPADVKRNTESIISALGGEDALSTFTPVIKALHEIVPEYPLLHWRHLHPLVQEKSKQYYEEKNYYTAFIEAMKKYVNDVREKSGERDATESDLMGKIFGSKNKKIDVVYKYKKRDGKDFSDNTKMNIQQGQQYLSQGIVFGGRNPLAHEEIEELKTSDLFSEKDCLDLLSLLSHLFKRLDKGEVV